MATYKRKRGPFGGGGTYKAGRSVKRSKPSPFIKGRDRTEGYYGRYASGSELKFFDVDVTDAVVASGGTIQNTGSLNLISQGTGEEQRIGRKCTIKSAHWRYRVKLPPTDADALPGEGDSVRIIVYVDKQCNGVTAAVTDILEDDDIHSFRNLANSQRFNLLMDKMVTLTYAGLGSDGAGVISSAASHKEFTWNKACNIDIEFNNTTGALTEIRSNNIGVLLVGNKGVAGFDGKWRFRFKG